MEIMRRFNAAGVIVIAFVIGGAFYFEFAFQQTPCIYCLMIRGCFTIMAFGALMNVRYGIRLSHYAICLAGALLGTVVAFFDIITSYPPLSAWGSIPFMGLHLPSWGLISFLAAIGLIAIVICFDKQFVRPAGDALLARDSWFWLTVVAFAVIMLVTAGNIVVSANLCQAGFTCA